MEIVKRGTCEACPAYARGLCGLGRPVKQVLFPTNLYKNGYRTTIAPDGKCKRPKTYREFMETLRSKPTTKHQNEMPIL